MYIWFRYKFLIIFLVLAFGIPFFINKYSSFLFQGASSISSDSSVCLENNPPTLWIEKDLNSRKGYVPSGIKNIDFLELKLINCGPVNIKNISFLIKGVNIYKYKEGLDFNLNGLGFIFMPKYVSKVSNNEIKVFFDFPEMLKVSSMGSINNFKLNGSFPSEYFGKASFEVENVEIEDIKNSRVKISKANSVLIFVAK